MSAPNPSLLDSGQTLQGSYDEDSGSIRVKTDANESSIEVFQIDPDGLQTKAHLSVNGEYVTTENAVPVVLSANSGRSLKKIVTDTVEPIFSTPFDKRVSFLIKNVSDITCWIAFDETLANEDEGFPLEPGGFISVDLLSNVNLWASTESGTSDLRILETGRDV